MAQADGQTRVLGPAAGAALDPVLRAPCLHLVPKVLPDDGRVLAGIALGLVADLAAVDAVLQDAMEELEPLFS